MIAGESMTTHQSMIVTLKAATNNTVEKCDNASDVPFGVLMNKPASGGVAIVRVLGVARVKANTAGIAVADNIGTDADGRAIAKVLNKEYVFGKCLIAASGEDVVGVMTVNGLVATQLNV
jgi:hypothetical protein